ncbi:MAG: polysaccharide biosynthesis/export family protein [Bacteroidales bacterium]|nr:polysaccharide biosynthesis/export family protein [Bacteroidales bacterium]MCM1147948.1 polysaccharide biosynthesis/export family protein [Bacteroidales bacterium]MCM1206872.1 polysaccharide biosynthesis/export family protein [Bacillota bacterium]MCM1509505.1 polysaccharide biosynthesis/export family protein [Clostridium sp.]
MKKIYLLFSFVVAVVILTGCSSSKNVVYFQNADEVSLEASRILYDAKIMPKDMLSISVYTTDPETSAPFNLFASAAQGATGGSNTKANTYLVDNDGCIDFPVLGRLHVLGMTKNQCQNMIAEKMKPYLSVDETPIITVEMSSYRVTVLGEVASPKVVPVTTEKMSILEALAVAGDLTIYGKRDNILLIREDAAGKKTMHRLDITDANLINSPYFYIQQNDVIYVEPNKVKARNSAISTSTTIWLTLVSSLVSIASLVVSIAK